STREIAPARALSHERFSAAQAAGAGEAGGRAEADPGRAWAGAAAVERLHAHAEVAAVAGAVARLMTQLGVKQRVAVGQPARAGVGAHGATARRHDRRVHVTRQVHRETTIRLLHIAVAGAGALGEHAAVGAR